MFTVNTFFETTGFREIVVPLVNVMAENFEDFAAAQTCFQDTIASLVKELGAGSSPSVTEEIEAIYQQVGSSLLFSCFLGFKANYDHFIDPVGRTFLDVDPETYLREDIARQLPDYQNARRVQEQFYAALSPAQQDQYDAITTYISHLETVGPKLAHYYGYLLGNQLFPHVIPGYVADSKLTFRYQNMLEKYFGVGIK